MLWVYVPRGTSLDRISVTSDADIPDSAVWFDLVNPNSQEDKMVERRVGIAVLPDYCVQPESGLVRLLPEADMPEMECFLVYTEELKNVARVHAFRDFLVSTAQRWRY